jgi:predicted PurR-regulated permease PerM
MSAPPKAVLVPRETPLTLSQKVARAVVFALIALAALGVGWALRFLMGPLLMAVVLFYVLNPLVNWLENRGVPRTASVIVWYVAGLSLLFVVIALLWPSLELWLKTAPQGGEKSAFELRLEQRLDTWEHQGLAAYPSVDWEAIFTKVRAVLETERRRMMETLPARLLEALSSAGTLLLGPVVVLFLLLDGARMRKRMMSWVPNRHFETALVLWHRVDRQIAAYLRGTAAESVLVGLLQALVLWAIGMPHALLFGVMLGVANVIPFVGPLLGASAALLYSLMDPSAPGIPLLVIVYAGVHVIDVLVISPWVVGKSLDLHPLTVILGLSVGGALGGLLGMLLSVPLIAVSKAVIGTLVDAFRRGELV